MHRKYILIMRMFTTFRSYPRVSFGSSTNRALNLYNFCIWNSNKTSWGALESPFNCWREAPKTVSVYKYYLQSAIKVKVLAPDIYLTYPVKFHTLHYNLLIYLYDFCWEYENISKWFIIPSFWDIDPLVSFELKKNFCNFLLLVASIL